MAHDTTSPFTPGRPVPVEFFIGRSNEVTRLQRKAANALAPRIEPVFVTGERGIGKSSLASFARSLCEQKQRMLGLHVFLGGVKSLEEMTRRVFDELLKQSIHAKWWDRLKSLFGGHVKGLGLFGVSLSFAPPRSELESLVHAFPRALSTVQDRLKGERDGLFIILDDINGLAESDEFANWLKSFVDEVSTSGKAVPLCFVLVGLEQRRQSLIAAQPSLARVFDIIDIPSWSDGEAREFFSDTLGQVGMTVEDAALDELVRFTGGLPMLAHELGDAAYGHDTDGVIDVADARAAVVAAAEIVGRKYLQPNVFAAIRSDRYRSILRKLANRPLALSFTRGDALQRLSPDEGKVFDNFLRRMVTIDVIERDEEHGRGAYRFTNLLHYTYFWIEARRAGQNQ